MSVIDELYGKNVKKEAEDILSVLTLTQKQIIEISKTQIDFFGGKTASNPKDLTMNIEKFEKAQKSLQAQVDRNRLSEIKLQQAREKAFDSFEKGYQKEQQLLTASQNLYNKTQTQLNAVQKAYNDLAVKKERYNNLTANEEMRLNTLSKVTEKYNATLKAVDATVGKHTRNVGNYASAFNPLSNSINQLGREAPAFANSVQTGFMAISNNLPIFFDAMGNVIAQNKELQAQGLPTKSALNQLAGALFSFQTLLSVGVTLLTLYGKEIVNWTMDLMGAKTALESFNEVNFEANLNRQKGIAIIKNEYEEYKRYKKIATDANLPLEERKVAIEKLRSMSDWYLKNLTDQELMSAKLTTKEKEYLEAKKQQVRFQEESKNTENIQNKINEINVELKARESFHQRLISLEDVRFNRNGKRTALEVIYADQAIADLEKEEKIRNKNTKNEELRSAKSISLMQEKEKLEILYSKSLENTSFYKQKMIMLEYKEDKQRDKKKRDLRTLLDLEIEARDFYASDYALRKQIIDNTIEGNKRLFDDEKKTFDQRQDAYAKMMQAKLFSIQMAYEEEARLIDKKETDDTHKITLEYNKRIDEIKKLEANKNVIYTDGANDRNQALNEKDKALIALEKDAFNLRELATVKFVNNQVVLADEYSKEVIEKLNAKIKLNAGENLISENQLKSLQDYQKFIESFTDRSTLKDFENAENFKANIVKESTISNLELKIAAEQEITDKLQKGTEAYEASITKKIALEIQLANLKAQIWEKEEARLKKLKEDQVAYLQSFQQSWDSIGLKSLDFFTALEANGKTAFQNLTDGAINTKEEIALTFVSIAEVFQDAMNLINEASERRFEKEKDALKRQKDISIAFAGESATAKAEIERQYEERLKRIEHERAVRQKKQAIFNAVINTAQAVTSALASYDYVSAVLFAVLGAAQIAVISSQEIPEYYLGTDNAKEGLAYTQEKGAEIITDKNGKVKTTGTNKGAQLTMMEKGDKVYTAEQSKEMMFNKMFNNLMIDNGINHSSQQQNNSLSKEDFNSGINRLQKTIDSKESFEITRDARGERIYKKSQGNKIELLNNRLKIKSFNV